MVQLLVNSGADIDAQDNRKVSCLMAAFRKGHIKVVKWMVKHVTQFPSDQEMTRTLALVNDKEMLKKCNQCMEIIRLAKEKQAAEANKNATILLEELESERIRAENKKAKLASKREKKKAKKKEKKGGKGGDAASGTTNGGSKSGKDGGKKVTKNDSSSESESDIDEEDPSSSYDDHLTSLPDPVTYQEPAPPVVLREVTITKKSVPTIQSSSQQKRPSSDQPMSPSKDSKKSKQPVQVVEVSTTTITATTLKSGKEVKPNQARKSSVPSVTIEPVVVEPSKLASKKTEPLKNLKANVSSTTTKKVQPTTQRQSTPPGTIHSKHGSTDVPRVPTPSSPATGKGSNRQSSGHHSATQSSSHVQQGTKYDSESEWPIGHFDSVGTWSGTTSSTMASSNEWKPVKQTATGWKEVTRRSKKVAVPSTAISRVIGRGGCNINAVREISGAHIEVEKQKGQQSDRQILIKGTQDATRNAQLMINALVNEPDKDLNQIIASLGLSKPTTEVTSDHFMTTDSNVFERIPSAGFNVGPPTVPASGSSGGSRSKVNSSGIGANSSSTVTPSGNKSTTSSVTGTTSTMIGSNVAKDSSTKIGVFSTMSSSSATGTTSGVVRTNKPVASATTPAFTSSLTWANKSQSPRPGIVASTTTSSSKASGGQATVTEKPTTPSPFGSGSKVTSGAQQPFAPKSPSSSVHGGSPPSATSQYTPFNDTFGKVTGSVWGKSSSEKVNFANIVKGTLTSASGEVLNSGQNTSSQGSPGALHVHPSTSPDLNVSIADQSKAPGFRGPNYASPGISCNQQQQQSGLNYGNFSQGHRSAPCTPPLVPAGHPAQQMSPESTPVQESSPQLRSTSSSSAADHFGSMYQTSGAPFSPGSSKNFSLAPGSRPQGQSSYGNQGYTTPSSYNMMSSDRSQSPSSAMMDHGTMSGDANSGLNPNAPSYAPDSPAGQAAAHVRMLSNHLAHTNNLLRTASMQPSGQMSAGGQMSASGSPMHSQSQSSGQLRSFDGQGQVPNPHLQMQMRAAILAAGASLQMQAQQQQQARFQASMAAHHSVQPTMNQSIMVQQQMAYNSIAGPDFAPASADALRLLQTALMNTTTSSIPGGHYGQGAGQMVPNHASSSTGQGQPMGQSSSTGSSRPTAGVIGAGRKISSQSSGIMSEASNQDGGQGQDQSGGDSSPESKSVPRPIGTERAQKTSQLKNPYHGIPSPGVIGSTNFGTTSDNLWNLDPLTSGHGAGMMSGGMMSDMDWMAASQMAPSGPMDQSSFMSNLLASSQSYATGNSGLNRGYIDPTFGADPLLGAAMNGAAAGMIGGQGGIGLGQQSGLGGLPFGVPTGQTGNEAADYWTGKLPLGSYDTGNQATNPTSNASWYNY